MAQERNSAAAPSKDQSKVETVEGKVQFQQAGSTTWIPANPGQALQIRDKVRTDKNSRATLRLADLSTMRVNELTTFELLPPQKLDRKPLLDLKSGSLYFFSREKPADIQFRTPTAAGAIRGTEFILQALDNGDTYLALLDGEVELGNDAGQITMHGGEQARVPQGQPPTKTALIEAQNVIQWCLYYPAVVDADEITFTTQQRESLRESLTAYRAGDLLAALAAFPTDKVELTEATRIYHAGLLLSVGRVDAANQLLESAHAESGTAQALREMIAAVQRKPWSRATPPALASEWLAESYYLQSRADLPAALKAARAAVAKSPSFGFAWVRVAELEFSFGHVKEARAALDAGLKQSPRNAQALALEGFLAAARNQTTEAIRWFNKAIAVDGALANAWLGRGLCKIRQGQHEEGRKDLQVAATLEPQRSILRSYLAKAFSGEGKEVLAAKDLRLARELDPKDPTSCLYSALLNQQGNQINQAVRELETSQSLNDNQKAFRSALLLDQDRAVRGANLASIYRDAGMEDLSQREAAKAVSYDYANPSAHLFLANSYENLRDPKYFNLRYEAPARDEWLIANLLAPVGVGSLSRNVSQQDYVRLFERDGFGISSTTEYFSQGEWRESGSQYGRFGNVAYSVDAFYHTDVGWRPNNDLEAVQLSAQLKIQVTPQDTLFFQAERFTQDAGDVAQYYDQNSANTGFRVEEEQTPNLFLGYHHEWNPNSHTLFLAGRAVHSLDITNPSAQPFFLRLDTNGVPTRVRREPFYALDYERDHEVYLVEAQHILQLDLHTLIFGGSYQNGTSDTFAQLNQQVSGPMSSQNASTDMERLTFYGYWQWQIWQPLRVTAGLSYDRLTYPRNILYAPITDQTTEQDHVSPKIGLIYTPWQRTTLRALYAQSLGGVFNENSFRLEPTEIAGLNQSYRSLIPESAAGFVPAQQLEVWSASIDQSFSTDTYLGLQFENLESDADQTIGAFTNSIALALPNAFSSTRRTLDFKEKALTFTADQLIDKNWSVGARYRISEATLHGRFPDVPDNAIWQVADFPKNQNESGTLQQVILHLLYNHRCGFFAQFQSRWTGQSNQGYTPDPPGENFWQHDFFVGYRFLKRRAEVRLGILNLTDQDYRLNPLNLYSELPRERTFTAKLKLNF